MDRNREEPRDIEALIAAHSRLKSTHFAGNLISSSNPLADNFAHQNYTNENVCTAADISNLRMYQHEI